MLRFDFKFLRPINPRLELYLDTAQSCMGTDPHNTMCKVRACLEFMVKDMIKKERIEVKKQHGTGTLNENVDILKKKKVLDRKGKSACDVARSACNEVVHSLEADTEWAQLCMRHMHIFCKWYAQKYYKIVSNEKIKITNDNKATRQEYIAPILPEQAKQAYKNLSIDIHNKHDALILISSVNLLNAYVKQTDAILFMRPRYIFKDILVERLEEIIKNKIDGVDIYFTTDITYVKLFDLQFSFKYLIPNEFMKMYSTSQHNKIQHWEGIRLQPCAGIVFECAIEMAS